LTDRYREAESFATDLAAAATQVFGPGWLERSGVPVLHLTPRVMASLAAPVNGRPDERTFAATQLRNTTPDQTRSATRADLDREPPQPSALWPKLAAFSALLILTVVAFLTPATLPHPAVATVTVDGAGIAEPVTVDLARSITVTGEGAGPDPVNVTLTMSAAGVSLGSAAEVAEPDQNGRFSAEVEMPAVARWIVGGAVTGEVRWSRAGRADTVQPFTLLTRQHPLASAMGTGSLLLALFALAYLESGLRTIRNGHRWRSGRFGSPILGALFGAAGWLFVSVLSSHEPSGPSGLGCALAGALAAVFTLLATERSARS
jgi:serine/threonine-protein kinase